MQKDRQTIRMCVAVGISWLVVLGIWVVQLKQTVWRVRPQNIRESVREEFGTVFGEEQPPRAPAAAPASQESEINQAAVERLSEELKTESQ